MEDLHVCFLDLAVIIFVDLGEFVSDLKEFFWTEMVFVFDTVFIFWTRAPAWWTLLPYMGWGETPLFILCAHIGLDVFRPWHLLFGTCTCFFGPGTVGEFRYCGKMHEIRILKQHKRKKWWRGRRDWPTYEAKWMQEVERHMGWKGKLDIETRWAQ